MANYFKYFPKTIYTLDNNNRIINEVTDLTSKFTFDNTFKNNSVLYYMYSIADDDTPEILADKVYGNSERHWIILALNDIVNPIDQWPLSQTNFMNYVEKKYKANAQINQNGIDWAKANVYQYLKIISTTNKSTNTVDIKTLVLDHTTYNSTPELTTNTYTVDNIIFTVKETKGYMTYFQHEEYINESKRKIKLLRPEYVNNVENEFRKVFK